MKWIRPAIIGMLAMAVTLGFFLKMVSMEVYVPFATGLIVYWFKSRDTEKQNGNGAGGTTS